MHIALSLAALVFFVLSVTSSAITLLYGDVQMLIFGFVFLQTALILSIISSYFKPKE